MDVVGPLIYDFLQTVLWDGEGYLHLATKRAEDGVWKNVWYGWPDDAAPIIEWCMEQLRGHNLYFSPTLYTEPNAKKQFANEVQISCWCDLDEALPSQFTDVVRPPVQMETSVGRWQAFWPLDQLTPTETVEEINKRIARSLTGRPDTEAGWATGKMMRLPYTWNYKRSIDNPWQIRLPLSTEQRAQIALFAALPEVEESKIHGSLLPPDVSELPHGGDADELLAGRRLTPESYELIHRPPVTDDWSRAFWLLLCNLFEEGFTAREVFVIAMAAKCNKFVRDKRPPANTWIDVLRAERRYNEQLGTITRMPTITVGSQNGNGAHEEEHEVVGPPEFLNAQEVEQVRQRNSFVQRYADWACKQTDAPRTYHEAWGFLLLSCVLAGNLRISTSFGMLPPNLWLMVLADTTLTRKSTAEAMATRLILEVNQDIIVANDLSMEGLLSSLALRSREPSLLSRDEITGLVDGMAKKDYMAGMLEALCKLYDGSGIKRVLRSGTIDVRDPIFLFYGGGLFTKMQSILTDEHVTSGFIPRFLVITAETRHEDRRPLGRWSPDLAGEQEALVRHLIELSARYTPPVPTISIGGVTTLQTRPNIVADLTDEAWETYNKIEAAYVEMALHSQRTDLNVPTMDRFSKHLLKLSALAAADRTAPTGLLLDVTKDDVLYALSYMQEWAPMVLRLLAGMGRTSQERMIDRAYRLITRNPEGATRSSIMRSMHLTAWEADNIFKTLHQRELIELTGRGRYMATTLERQT